MNELYCKALGLQQKLKDNEYIQVYVYTEADVKSGKIAKARLKEYGSGGVVFHYKPLARNIDGTRRETYFELRYFDKQPVRILCSQSLVCFLQNCNEVKYIKRHDDFDLKYEFRLKNEDEAVKVCQSLIDAYSDIAGLQRSEGKHNIRDFTISKETENYINISQINEMKTKEYEKPANRERKYLSKERYEQLKKEFGEVSSWAVWSLDISTPKANTGDLSVFQNPHLLQILNPQYVFVGLNASNTHIPKDGIQVRVWGNFHSTDDTRQQDYKLRYALKNTPFWGAYMTDIIKRYGEVDSNKVAKYLKNHPEVVKYNISAFKREIELLGTKPILIAMGDKTYNILNDYLSNEYKIYKICHYSHRVNPDRYREDVLSKLKECI